MTTTQQSGSVGTQSPQPAPLDQAREVVGHIAQSMGRVIAGKPEAIRLSLVALLADWRAIGGSVAQTPAQTPAK